MKKNQNKRDVKTILVHIAITTFYKLMIYIQSGTIVPKGEGRDVNGQDFFRTVRTNSFKKLCP